MRSVETPASTRRSRHVEHVQPQSAFFERLTFCRGGRILALGDEGDRFERMRRADRHK